MEIDNPSRPATAAGLRPPRQGSLWRHANERAHAMSRQPASPSTGPLGPLPGATVMDAPHIAPRRRDNGRGSGSRWGSCVGPEAGRRSWSACGRSTRSRCGARRAAALRLDELKQSLLEYDVDLEVRLNDKMHDREVRLDNGWTIKIGRGLDPYQKPEGWYAVGANDLSLRRCMETKVDVFRAAPSQKR